MMIKHDLKMILFSVDCNLNLGFEKESIKKNCTERKGQQVTPIQVVRHKKRVSQKGREGGARLVSINRQVKQGVSLKQSPATSVPLCFHSSISKHKQW